MITFTDISAKTADAFYGCLSIPQSDAAVRRQWQEENQTRGARGKVLLRDDVVIGKCLYGPIELSPLEGQDLMVIFCLCVHIYDTPPGDQRGKGYGRLMLETVEADARARNSRGLAVWAMDWTWNPVSFYLHAGFVEVDREDKVVVAWKPFFKDAKPPRIMRLPHPPKTGGNKVSVVVADNAWCNGFHKKQVARDAVAGLEDIIDYREVPPPCDGRILHLGKVGGVFLDGELYRPYQLIGKSSELRDHIRDLYARKKG